MPGMMSTWVFWYTSHGVMPGVGRGKTLAVSSTASSMASLALPKPAGADDPSIDVYIYVSGAVCQHGREGFRLGTLTSRGRDWLRVMIYVPDELEEESAAVEYFRETLNSVAAAVEERLRARRPNWPVEELAAQVRSLRPERMTAA